MLSLRQLLTPVPEDEALSFCLETLDSLGFQATSWQSNSAARTLVQLFARVVSDVTYSIADMTSGGFAGLAKGPYADLVGEHMFRLTREQAQPTVGLMVLANSIASSAHTFSKGELLIGVGPQADAGLTYSVDSLQSAPGTDPITINPGDSLLVFVSASAPGAAGNGVPANAANLELWTPLTGVTVTNPPQPPLTPQGTWITSAGLDAETDGPGGRYNARMLGRWDRLAYGNNDGAYRAWALEALPELTRVNVREGTAPFSVRITGATAVGGLDAGQISTIRNYIYGITDGVGRRPINDVVTVASAIQVTTPPLAITIYVQSPFSSDAIARVSSALTLLFGKLPIGGKRVTNSGPGKVLLADLYQTVMKQQGVLNVTIGLTTDIVLGIDDVYEPVPTITMVIV